MVVNRYTNMSGAQFDPLSLQELSLIPANLRNQQNELEDAAGKMTGLNSKRLSVDDPLVKDAINGFEGDLNDYVDNLSNEGFNDINKGRLRELARKRSDLLSPTGELGKAEAAYNAYEANRKELKNLYDKGHISADKYQKGIQNALSAYEEGQGVAGGAQFNPFTAVHDQDINKMARQIALDIQKNPKKLENLGLTAKTLPNGLTRYYDNKTGREYTPEGAIQVGVEALLKQDPNVVSDLTQRQQLGIIQDPNSYLKGLGKTYEALYSKDNVTRSRSGFFDPLQLHEAKKGIDKKLDDGALDFEGYVTSSTDIHQKGVIESLANVASGKKQIVASHYINRGDASILEPIWDMITGNAPMKPIKYEALSPAIRESVEDIKQGLIRTGKLPENADMSNANHLSKVVNYMKEHQSVTTQPKLMTKDVNASTKLAKHIVNQAESREFYDPTTNEIYTYQQMIDKGYFSEDKKENYDAITYRGQLTSDNNYSNMVDSDARNGYVNPHVIKLGKKEFLVPGSMSELNSPKSKTDIRFNKFWNHLKNTADIPSPAQWRNPMTGQVEDIEIMRISTNSEDYKKYGSPYLMSRNGKVIPVSSDTFRKMQGDLKLQ